MLPFSALTVQAKNDEVHDCAFVHDLSAHELLPHEALLP